MKHAQRGQVWLVDLGMVAKVRPCLMIGTPGDDDERALVTIVPHTTAVRGSRYEVSLEVRFLRAGAFDCQNLSSLPRAKLQKKLGDLTSEQMQNVDSVLKLWLQLD